MKKLMQALILPVTFLAYSHFASGALEKKVNGEYVTLSGKVTAVAPDAFSLKVDGETVLVEMDDYDWDADGYKLVKGDQVVVSGRVDHDFLEKKKVEAGSVYVKGLNSYFYASSDDEEDHPFISTSYLSIAKLPESASVDLQGIVTNVDGREFTVDTGLRKVRVDTDDLIYNPMDNKGYTQIDLGDRVRVSGLVDDNFFEGKEVSANFVTEL